MKTYREHLEEIEQHDRQMERDLHLMKWVAIGIYLCLAVIGLAAFAMFLGYIGALG